MKSNPKADLVIDALLMALWRRKPEGRVLIHSDQGVQYTCTDWRKFVSDNNLELSMSRRGNCHGNNDGMSPVEFEKRYYEKLSSLQETGGLPQRVLTETTIVVQRA
jgi:transposase InsO family protein